VPALNTYQGRGAQSLRAKDGMQLDIPTCRLTERLGDIWARVQVAGANTAKGEAKNVAAGAATKVFQATSVVGDHIGSLADVIREKTPQEGTVRTVATAVPIRSVRGGPWSWALWLVAESWRLRAERGGYVCPPHRPDYRKIPTF
jgi:hypothetical protein